MNWKNNFLYLTFLLLSIHFIHPQPTSAETEEMDAMVQEGEQIFTSECTQCHAIDRQVVGPKLKNVTDRLDQDWLIRFIRNSQEVIREGDEYAVEIYEEFNRMVMPAVELSDDEIRSVLAYIEHESKRLDDEPEQVATGESGHTGIATIQTDTTTLNRLIVAVIILVLIILFLTVQIMMNLLRINGVNVDRFVNWQRSSAILMPVFLIAGFGLIIYQWIIHGKYVVFPGMPSASEHGVTIDNLFIVTLVLTGIVFIITHIMLFVFAYQYRYKKERKAYFYPDNHKLEIFWTAIPAIVLTTLVLFGYTSWRSITYDMPRDTELPKVEVLAEQFAWNFRYPGESGKLGKTNYLLFEENAMGLDFEDEYAQDDIVTRELWLPVNQEVILKFRSKDVIHSAHLHHFRLQMYTTPGMPSQFRFTPTKTTEEMRQITGNEDFEFELACNQICGVAHYNMRSVVKIVEQDEYEAWLNEQTTYYERRR